jgi:hypothetical protein
VLTRAHAGRRALVVALAAAYALGAAATTPFTWQADLVTALPIGALAVAAVARWPARPRARPEGGVPRSVGHAARPRHPYLAWLVVLAAVVTWELVQYASAGSRGLHPTLSSMADAVDRHVGPEAVVFFLWLCLGAAIVRAGTIPHPARGTTDAGGDTP